MGEKNENSQFIINLTFGLLIAFTITSLFMVTVKMLNTRRNYKKKFDILLKILNHAECNSKTMESAKRESNGYEEPIVHDENIYDEIDYEKFKAEEVVVIDGHEYIQIDTLNAARYLKITQTRKN